ncbi:MAG: zinc-dependent alcohol dehydrogenase [Moorellaceae bacterium]
MCETLGFLGIDAPGGMAEYVAVPVKNLYPIENLSYEEAALVEPVAVAVHAVRRSGFKVGEIGVILGGGTIGQLVAQVLLGAGAAEIIISETSPYRREYLGRLPIKVVDPAKEGLKENTADVVFEAAGVAETISQAVSVARVRGTIVQLGLPKTPVPLDLVKVAFKELSWIGTRVYNRWDYLAAIELLRRGKIKRDTLVTHVLPLEEGAWGIELVSQGQGIKVLLKP